MARNTLSELWEGKEVEARWFTRIVRFSHLSTKIDDRRNALTFESSSIHSPTSVMNPYFQLAGIDPCDPFMASHISCDVHDHVKLAVNAT